MKKEYKSPSIEVVKIEQTLLQALSTHDVPGNGQQLAPGYGGKGRARYEEDDFDDEDEEDL